MKKQHIIIGASALAVLSGATIAIYKGMPQLWYKWFKAKLWDYRTEEAIENLHPKIQGKVRAFIKAAEKKGINLRITSDGGYRSPEEQDRLYAQGRTTGGKIVTNAKALQSYHNFGLAIDVVEIKDGQAIWNNPRQAEIVAIAKKLGFEWGGDWSRPDKPHFQYTFGKSTSELAALHNQNPTEFVKV